MNAHKAQHILSHTVPDKNTVQIKSNKRVYRIMQQTHVEAHIAC